MEENQQSDRFPCPFCISGNIPSVPGKAVCPECGTSFEIDDRGECVFVDPLIPKLPINGTYCPACGLVQDAENENCVLCKARLVETIQ